VLSDIVVDQDVGAQPVLHVLALAILGFLIVGLLTILHSRYIWFPFEPIGFVFSMTPGIIVTGLWFSFLVAWILKTLLIRVGGSKAYEDYGMPVAGGVVGWCMLLTGGVVGVIRFYFTLKCLHVAYWFI
jgi:hypothetical protein